MLLHIHIGHMDSELPHALLLHDVSLFPVYLFYIHIPDIDIDTPDVLPEHVF